MIARNHQFIGVNKAIENIKPKEELIRLLEETLVAIEVFLKDEVHFDLSELIGTEGLEKLAAMEKA